MERGGAGRVAGVGDGVHRLTILLCVVAVREMVRAEWIEREIHAQAAHFFRVNILEERAREGQLLVGMCLLCLLFASVARLGLRLADDGALLLLLLLNAPQWAVGERVDGVGGDRLMVALVVVQGV